MFFLFIFQTIYLFVIKGWATFYKTKLMNKLYKNVVLFYYVLF